MLAAAANNTLSLRSSFVHFVCYDRYQSCTQKITKKPDHAAGGLVVDVNINDPSYVDMPSIIVLLICNTFSWLSLYNVFQDSLFLHVLKQGVFLVRFQNERCEEISFPNLQQLMFQVFTLQHLLVFRSPMVSLKHMSLRCVLMPWLVFRRPVIN